MSWIQTYTGRKVDPLKMCVADVCIEDIAHALAMKCRYTGHCPQFYSVAQHSVLVAQNCPTQPLWGLLHDAAEAYLADISRPVKIGLRERIGSVFDEIEDAIMAVVCVRFGLPLEQPEEVKAADVLLLATEARCFFGDSRLYSEWDHRPENGHKIINPAIVSVVSWQESEKMFMDSFRSLAR